MNVWTWREEADRLDVAVYAAIAATPTPVLDEALRRLSRAANHSRLWLGCSAVLAAAGGRRGRTAAANGVASIALTSAVVNLVLKPVGNRRRPDRDTHAVPLSRQVEMPRSTSWPSGHAGSAFAFATGVGAAWPAAAVPLSAAGCAGRVLARAHRRALPVRRDRRGRRRRGAGARRRRGSAQAPFQTPMTDVRLSISIKTMVLVAATVALAWALASVADVLLVIFVSAFSVAVLLPVVSALERLGWSRRLSSMVVVLGIVLVIGAVVIVLAQAIGEAFRGFSADVPTLVGRASDSELGRVINEGGGALDTFASTRATSPRASARSRAASRMSASPPLGR